MNYAERERNPARHLPSITMVVVLHLLMGYALVTGLARKAIDVLKQPIETKIIEEIKKPPPDTPPPPPPKLALPPPPFIPAPEINIQAPTQAAPTITTAPAAKMATTSPSPTFRNIRDILVHLVNSERRAPYLPARKKVSRAGRRW